ncbi:hypothetical protein MSPP1_000081 [Malassezia sp. CBS 17886]|nr:hypothetical protein MSPP1_000081 [Malassezia sp. CBS 17886]
MSHAALPQRLADILGLGTYTDLTGTSHVAKALIDAYVRERFPASANTSASAGHQRPSTPVTPRTPEHPRSPAPPRRDARPIRVTPGNVTEALARASQGAPLALPPTAEMRHLDDVMAILGTEPASGPPSPAARRVCLCQAYAPLCMACGLVLCAALQPAPISPQSSCASCGASPILSPMARMRLLAELAEARDRLAHEQLEEEEQRQQTTVYAQRHAHNSAAAFPVLGTPVESAPQAANGPRNRVLRLDMKTHKVTATRRKEKSAGASPRETPEVALADDGSSLVLDDADDGFRARTHADGMEPPSDGAPGTWEALLAHEPHHVAYVAEDERPCALAPLESETPTDAPDVDMLLQKNPVGSSAETQRRNRNAAATAAVARSHGRKSGKAGRPQ